MLEKIFDAKSVEPKWRSAWAEAKVGAADRESSAQPYTIMMPPPNVTGTLHMGHALTMGLQDLLIRYHRMSGRNTLWQPGMDHAGIAVQAIVDQQLSTEGLRKEDIGREKFLRRAWGWKAKSGGRIGSQLRALGASPDWDRECFTLDAGRSEAVKRVFVQLYREGLIYKDKRLVNWDTKLQTAISDLEVEQQETKGHLWHLRYPLDHDPSQLLIVATTRPETLLGDTAVAVHPEDARFKHLIGQMVRLPLTQRLIPIIGDSYADPEKGSGAVKITPAHDFNDFAVGRRNNLPLINILNRDGTLNDVVPEEFRGLGVGEARKAVLARAEAEGWLDRVEDHVLQVPLGDRSKSVIEPLLTKQWFADAATLAKPALEAVQTGKTKFVPENWSHTYYDWMRNIEPWCISRQLWWGHQIPAWYDAEGKIYVAEDAASAQAQAGEGVVLTRDPDVLDTWFSSALWPFSTLGWPEQTTELERYYPGDVLVTGHDIIFFWVARMMMMGLHFMGEVPFRTVYIHALVRDETGAKMSKSKGNVIDPLEVSKIYGTDALRFTLAALASPGNDLKLSLDRVEDSRNFVTKIWNTARYIELRQATVPADFDPITVRHPLNQWILAAMAQMQNKVTKAIETYHFNDAAAGLYHFIWDLFCPWYLEFTKPLMAADDARLVAETKATLAHSFTHLLHLLHPILPFVTEELWAGYFQTATGAEEGLLTVRGLPAAPDLVAGVGAEEMNFICDLITAVRSAKADLNLTPGLRLSLIVMGASDLAQRCLANHRSLLSFVGRIDGVEAATEVPNGAVTLVVQGVTFALPLKGLIDIAAEQERLAKECSKAEAEIEKLNKTLGNPSFLARAPTAVVAKQRTAHATLEQELALLKQAEDRLARM